MFAAQVLQVLRLFQMVKPVSTWLCLFKLAVGKQFNSVVELL